MSTLNYQKISELDKEYGTPFYLMYPNIYQHNLQAFISAFKIRYDRILTGYSFKTNYVPSLCQYAKNEGCYAEVVSEMEYQLAEQLGFEKIILNGPIKKESILYHAIESRAIINLDSEYEVESVCKYRELHPNTTIKVGLRINVMLTDSEGNSTIQCGLRVGRFGFPLDILDKNISRLRDNNIIINSLHGHTSSSDRVPFNYQIITKRMLHVCEKYQLNDLEYFDVGGGFFGAAAEGFDTSGRPTYKDYANIILDTVLANEWFLNHKPFLIIEPGASVVSNVFDLVTKVFQTKHIGNVKFASVDGSIYDVKPTMHLYNPPCKAFQNIKSNEIIQYDIVGSTCMEKDVILKGVELPRLHHGDYLLIKGLGAYTISLTPTFINYLSPIIECTENSYTVIRRRQTIEDVLSIYKF